MIGIRKTCRICWLALGLAVLLVPSGRGEPAAPASGGRAVSVVLDDNYPPYIFRDESGQLQGILADMWTLWSDRTGTPVDLRAMDWSKAQAQMQAGQADAIDTLFQTPARERLYEFSPPSATIDTAIFFHESISGITGPDSLKGFTVGVKAGDACIEFLESRGVGNFRPYPSYQGLIEGALRKEIRVFCIDKAPALYLLYRHGLEGSFRYSPALYTGQFHRAYLKDRPNRHAEIEAGFARIRPEELKAIEDKWLGTALGESKLTAIGKLTGYVLLSIVVLAIVLLLWNGLLRRRVAYRTHELRQTLETLQTTNVALEQTRDYLTATLEAIPDLLFELDAEGRHFDYRASREELLAAPPKDLLGHTVTEVMPAQAAQTVLDALREAAESGHSHGKQICLPLAQGDHYFELSVSRKNRVAGSDDRFIVLSRDITERKRAEADIERLAFFDGLTQLPNRNQLHDRLRHALATSQRRGSLGALLFIDLDDFKTLNDTKGHRAGDLLLQEVGRRLQSCIRAEDFVARLGGDEFVVMLEDLSARSDEAATQAEVVGEKILDATRHPYVVEGQDHYSTASIGVTLFDGAHDSSEELLKRADAAMYRAKSAGRNGLRFFDPSMQTTLEARAQLESDLRTALREHQFMIFLQPQIAENGAILGAEALIRWRQPARGIVPPGHFIPLAEETGLIMPIGLWVLENACELLRDWGQHPSTHHLTLAINVSARQFRQADFVQQVSSVLVRIGVNPSLLKLELTESLVLENVQDAIEKMRALKAIGICLSMDDFGTGYSSLSYLKRLPLDQLKIDQSFVRDIDTDAGDAAIVKTIIAMAHTLGMDVIAEGVENEAQRNFLSDNGCKVFQGYFFSQPVPIDDFRQLLPAMN